MSLSQALNQFAQNLGRYRVPHNDINDYWMYQFEGRYITLPSSNPPSHEFIEYHQKHVFLTA